MSRILILSGAPRKNGYTENMVRAFTEGAQRSGNSVQEMRVADMNIHGCLGCMQCMNLPKDSNHICVQKDDMDQVYSAVMEADVLVFASPMHWWGITGQLKTAVDRLEAVVGHAGIEHLRQKSTALLMTYAGGGAQAALDWYAVWNRVIGCKNLGAVIGYQTQYEDNARELGKSIH